MSHHSDENILFASSDSFWEPGNYRRTTKRIEDGYKLCNDLIALIQDRADIEKAYSKNLKSWTRKWNDHIEKSPEYGTMEAAWKGVLVEADRLSDLHVRVRDELCNDVIQTVKQWQKDTYHKVVLYIKERKEMEDAFKRAQKPWCKLLTKVNKTKNDYHVACKSERSAANQERNAAADSSLSMDQLKKMQDRVQKAKEEVTRAREKYELALGELNQYNPKYMEDMSIVFDKCQDMETTRLQFFKNCLFSIHKRLNISQDPILPQIYEEFYHTINNADHEKDLKWWSNNHGVNMAMNWPQFEEYTEEFRDISKGKVKEALPAGTITLINQRPVGEDLHDLPSINSKKKTTTLNSHQNNNNHRITVSDITLPTPNHEGGSKAKPPSPSKEGKKGAEIISSKSQTITNGGTNGRTNGTGSSGGARTPTGTAHDNGTSPTGGAGESNPFDEEEWEEEGGEEGEAVELVDTGEPGVPVRALYDYEGAENDELSFKQGELFEKLEDEDEQGWCKGRKDGRVGLYPANYVEPVP